MESRNEIASPKFWRSLEELAESGEADDFQDRIRDHFPRFANAFSLNRREFVKLMAASLALAGAGGCSRPLEKTVPYVRGQPQLAAGQPLFFATAVTCGGYASGVQVESNLGRPTKIEGNPAHPASLGATDAFTQAAVLDLWDPDRSQAVMKGSEIATWQELVAVLTSRMQAFAANGGAGLHVLTETVTSPTLAAQLRALLAKYPNARWHQYQPVNRDSVYDGARLAYGEALETRYRFDKAKVVVALDADFLGTLPGHVRSTRDFVGGRRVESGDGAMNRLYAVESSPSLTGAMADHRLPMRAADIFTIARALAQKIGVPIAFKIGAPATPHGGWIDAVAQELLVSPGASIVLAGDEQPPEVHALAHAINAQLGNVGATVVHTQTVAAEPESQRASLASLAGAMAAGSVDTLIVAGNPVYYAPADVGFAQALQRVKLAVHLGSYRDETAVKCHWHVPAAHELETWGDVRAFDGTVTIQQPLIAPLYGGKSAHELLAVLQGEPGRSSFEIVREHWRAALAGGEFESLWQTALHDGLVGDSAFPAKSVSLRADAIAGLPGAGGDPATDASRIELVFRPDPSIHDGRYANNAWLQELPRPLTKLTWGNAALMSPDLARRIDCVNGDVVELRISGKEAGRRVAVPVWLMPGHPAGSVTVTMGYGRTHSGRVGTGIGFNAFALRTSAAPWFASGLEIVKTGRREQLATTQHHHGMEGRDIVRTLSLAQLAAAKSKQSRAGQAGSRTSAQTALRAGPQSTSRSDPASAPSLYPPVAHDGYAWGMSVNLNTCIGCNACTIACQAENNIPIVGKAEVARGREMHWIRVDRYYEGEPDNPRALFQPVPCMQCEDAPCEIVCPTAASVHNSEGLNVQVYNRCVGTRFCSNNCPYKVRRFNFFQYAQDEPSLNAQRNPEVTVRQRGVMEKCSYCIQRIAKARIEADKENRQIRDGEVVTACQAACPAGAIVFGDLNDPTSEVVRMKASPLDYALLEELNTRPRTTYLAKVSNPNPELADGDIAKHEQRG